MIYLNNKKYLLFGYYDYLTNLPNRYKLLSSHDKGKCTIAFIDVGNFKLINDTYGHSFGDDYLKAIANMLQDIVGNSGVVFRFSGDEFIIRFDQKEKNLVIEILNKIIEGFKKAINVNGKEVFTTVNIGVYESNGNESLDDILRKADIAVCEAKRRGKGQIVFYEQKMEDDIRRKALISNELMQSLKRDEIRVVYQPIFDINKAKVDMIEALLRWDNVILGNVSPSEFIPIAEENGYIHELGKYLINEVYRAFNYLNSMGLNICISANLSPRQLTDDKLKDELNGLLLKDMDFAKKVILEITETQILSNESHNIDMLNKLRGLGIKIALDDFGKGFSSLNNLAFYPVDIIKIDKIFTQSMFENEKAKNIIQILIFASSKLGYKLVAEGVETREQFEYLKTIGCDKVQGYYIGKPVDVHVLIDEIKRIESGANKNL